MAAPITSLVAIRARGGEKTRAVKWAEWLSKTALEPSAAYRYGLLFAENELDEDDIPHFDHDFLLSMGITLAKHRLEILKLAQRRRFPSVFASAGNARRRLARRFRAIGGAAWTWGCVKVGALQSGKKMIKGGGGGFGDTVSCGMGGATTKWGCVKVSAFQNGRKMIKASGGNGIADKMRWDTMFQDLKPT
ncbi:uncharacterized protein LOC144713056 [Wolffia australiana]